MVSVKWQRLVQEKLFLAQNLLNCATQSRRNDSSEVPPQPFGLEAGLVQGATSLILQAREALLVLTAQLNQSKAVEVTSLETLAAILDDENADVLRLAELRETKGSWWSRLDELQHWLRSPREEPRRPLGENVIAVALDTAGPDRTPKALLALIDEMKRYLSELCQWHGEW